MFRSILLLSLLATFGNTEFLRVSLGRELYFGNTRVFLSGVNIAWNSYGYDFGNDNYAGQGPALEQWIREISAAGGNVLRIWVHVEGDSTPAFDGNGFATAPDRLGNFIGDMEKFLDVAEANNVFVVPVLWNGAVMRNQNVVQMVLDDAKLDSYITNVLRPLVRRLATKPALAAWEVINEPEGSVRIEANSNPCYDTTLIGQQGAGWTGNNIPMERFLRFINRQNAAIKQEDPKALITAGSWSQHSQNDAFGRNHYKDSCLVGAGGQAQGTIDFYQMHVYSWQGAWSPSAPFKVEASAYQLDKPVVIGEFSADCSENEGVNALWDYAYEKGYQGVWSWQYNAGGECSDTKAQQNQGMTHIKGYTHNGQIPINIQ